MASDTEPPAVRTAPGLPRDGANEPYAVAALYCFAPLPDYRDRRQPLTTLAEAHGVRGTLLLASEGVNGTIAGPPAGVEAVVSELRAWEGFSGLDVKWSRAASQPFIRLKVREKREIVTMGVADIDPRLTVGTYVDPQDWNALISDPDVVVVDTRNDYEVAIGTFERAVDPGTETFRQFPDWAERHLDPAKTPKVAMFCTGGIRCEKATALMKARGFSQVYHLKGGILKYLEVVAPEESLWRGECFVFDRRVSVTHGLRQGSYQLCSVCRNPVPAVSADTGYAPVDCPTCLATAPKERLERAEARRRQLALARKRGERHLGGRQASPQAASPDRSGTEE